MRYTINDDDIEAWIRYLQDYLEGKTGMETIQYVIDEMKAECRYHEQKKD